MNVTSAKFIKGVVKTDAILENGIPQIAFMGRSNVGKSSVINTLVHQKDLARTSSFPGRTQEINFYLINDSFYLIDLPGYGFAKASRPDRERLVALTDWYLFNSPYEQKIVVLIIDAYVGLTAMDLETVHSLEKHRKDIVVVANKMDKIKKTAVKKQLQKIQNLVGVHKVIAYSAEKKIGVGELTDEIFR